MLWTVAIPVTCADPWFAVNIVVIKAPAEPRRSLEGVKDAIKLASVRKVSALFVAAAIISWLSLLF
jgi:hypothetical protein